MSEDQAFVLDQISKNVYTLSPRRKGKSSVWNILSEIIKEDESILEGYLYCRTCSKILKYIPSQMSNLSRHKCCKFIKESKSLTSVSAEDKKAAIHTCVAWTTEDCQPFSAINGSGFIKLAKFFINIGAKYGHNVDIEDLLPDATTVSRTVQKLAEEKKKELSKEIAEVVQSGGASATIDLWTDNYVHRNFLGVTLHYQKSLKLYDLVLGMKSMDFDRSTGANILSKLKDLFLELGVNSLDKIKFVTDRGSNVVKALEYNVRLNCSSHLFANVLEHSFKETEELKEIVEACKKIFKYFKKANLQHHLAKSLKNECPTRWNSNFNMFKSIVNNWFQINEILKEKEESQRLLLISISTLKQLVDLCGDFDIIFKKLQICSTPSTCFIIPSITKIKRLCEPRNSDVAAILSLKENIINNVDKIWTTNLSLWQKTAFFLYPPALRMQQHDLSEIKNFCVSLIENFNEETPIPISTNTVSDPVANFQLSLTNDNISSDSDAESTKKSLKIDTQFFFPDLFKNPISRIIKTPAEEINRYYNETVDISEDFDVLKWWKLNESSYPLLSKFALQIHSIPASSAAAERAFSLAGNVITEKRNRLGPKSVDSLLFLHSYSKNF